MAVDKKEVSKFTSGIIAASSETDISDDYASFSLNVDSEFEKGALRGIKGNYILGDEGWELPRYAMWRIRVTGAGSNLNTKGFLLYAYNQTFFMYFNTTTTIPDAILQDEFITGNNITVINVNISAGDNSEALLAKLVTEINNLTTPYTLAQASGITHYFQSVVTKDVAQRDYLVVRSRFLGDIEDPDSTDDLLSVGGGDRRTRNSDYTTVYMYFSGQEINSEYSQNSDWNSEYDGFFVKGNGLLPINQDVESPLGFNFLYPINQKGNYNLFGITKQAKAVLLKNLGTSTFSITNLGDVSISNNLFDITAQQRNSNLYIGTGNTETTKSLWFGKIDRKQLDVVYNDEYILSENNLEPLGKHFGPISLDNLVVPTLHYGLNSTNGGIAGAANIYCDTNGNDVVGSGNRIRTVNDWAHQCLKNVDSTASTFDHYNDYKEGMIFRIDMQGAYVAKTNVTAIYNGSNTNGISAYDYLSRVKAFAKGTFEAQNIGVDDTSSDSSRGGSDGEALHSGDLFQLVYSPGTDVDIDRTVDESSTSLLRFVYVGHLIGDGNTTSHNSTDAYSGVSAYTYGHINDTPELYRIKNTSKNQNHIDSQDTVIVKDSTGANVESNPNVLESVNLADALGIANFQIGTIAECKSADGSGNFGGDTTNKNYYAGHGKLWVSNINDYNKLYLVDVSNWDNFNSANDRISFTEVTLNFDRLHDHLIATDFTPFGEGLVRLHYGVYGTSDKDNLIGDYASTWDPEPHNQYISSICETYSHKPHLGDGAGNGAANGDGKWRVWVNYNKKNDAMHTRWDLFLFNFRPQGINSSHSNDVQNGIGTSSNYEVYMYDKTPPYQECAELTLGVNENSQAGKVKIAYPYDKIAITEKQSSPNNSNYLNMHADGSNQNKGAEVFMDKSMRHRKSHFGDYSDSQTNIAFRNPSGETMNWVMFFGSTNTYEQANHMSFGGNIGWVSKENSYRQWRNNRHCMKPHFKEWYFTGNGSNESERISRTELSKPVAHIVSFVGRLSGSFVKYGGSLKNTNSVDPEGNFSGTSAWYGYAPRELEEYNNDLVLFSMHDSPVAFCTTTGSSDTKTAVFSSGETQGSPNVDINNVTTGSGSDVFFNDTEAGFLTDNSVPATQGYSRFNQYRYAHGHNGSAELNKDTSFADESSDVDTKANLRPGFINTTDYGKTNVGSENLDYTNARGSCYYGQDGMGHYNMITTTWASNDEILFEYNRDNYVDSTLNQHERIYGYGLDEFGQLNRDLTKTANRDAFGGRYFPRNGWDSTTEHLQAKTRFGTGYLTYRWPHKEDPQQAGSGGNPADFGDYGDEDAGYYASDDDMQSTNLDTSIFLTPSGQRWDNRKSVFCHSTTCLSESIFTKTDSTLSRYNHNNKYDALISPRCAFRKLSLPAGYQFEDITNIDFISWQNITADNTSEKRHGYILSGKAKDSFVNDLDTSSVLLAVVDNKTIDNFKITGGDNSDSGVNKNEKFYVRCQSKSAVSEIVPLLKQHNYEKNNYFQQHASYTNDNLIFKNLNPGLSDSPNKASYDRYFYKGGSNGYNTYYNDGAMYDVYCPIIVGNTGANETESISLWARPQFNPFNTGNNTGMGTFPYYRYDRLWNFWSKHTNSPNNKASDYTSYDTEAGFDMAFLDTGQSVQSDKKLMEGYGSTAGSMYVGNDDIYISQATYRDADNTDSGLGSHSKLLRSQLLTIESEEAANADGTDKEFSSGKQVYYKFSFTYDNFQESPLSSYAIKHSPTQDCKHLKLRLSLPNVEKLQLSPRVTHVNLYRKNDLVSLYRLVKSVNLNGKDDKFQTKDGLFTTIIIDERYTVSYEGLNGVSESLNNLTPNYALSCQLNDFLFVANINHPKIDEGSHILLRSKQGKFSVFDWSNDFLDLPIKPVAIVSFANRIFMFDDNNTFIINPEGLYIEEKTEGIGILNSQSFVVTDLGLFFCDRNNIYVHNGRSATPIGGPILYNHSRPEWQLGYIDAVKKAIALGTTPRIAFDSIKQCVYIILQGYSDADTQSFNTSYKSKDSRLYSYNIQNKRWDYYDCPNVQSVVTTGTGDVVMADNYQVYNYRVDKRNRESFDWESKEFVMGSSNYDKVFKRLYVTGELCLWNFNNSTVNPIATNDQTFDWGGGLSYETDNYYSSEDDTHLLETAPAAETDDLKVYVDGVLQTMRIQERKPHIGHYLANDKTNSIYTIETHLPSFENSDNGITDTDGNPLNNAFSLNINSLPEFVNPPHSQYPTTTKQGELGELTHIHRGQYLYFSGTDINGNKLEEFVKVRSIFFNWNQSFDGKNEISSLANSVKITCFRGLLGTKSINWNQQFNEGATINQIRIATPILRFPSGCKGKNVKVVFKNQKSYIDSFAVTYRKTRMK